MDQNARELLTAIMEVEFTCIELNLFLDTHPDDTAALEQFAIQSRRLRDLKKRFVREVGPLHNFGYSGYEAGSWVSATPWPWECK